MLRLASKLVNGRILTRALSDAPKSSATDKKNKMMIEKTPKGTLDDKPDDVPYEDPHLKRHPGGVNQTTGEVGGPAGPEPTRYGDWERKGRVSDF